MHWIGLFSAGLSRVFVDGQLVSDAWSNTPTYTGDAEVYLGNAGRVRYAEGLFIGYRNYEQTGTAPLYAFGYGLSCTSFGLC